MRSKYNSMKPLFRKGGKNEPGCLNCLKLGLKFQYPDLKIGIID
jgi:hypothetical protein